MLTPADLLRLRVQNSPMQSIGSEQNPNLLGNPFEQPSVPVNPYNQPPVEQNLFEQQPVQPSEQQEPPIEQNPYQSEEQPVQQPDPFQQQQQQQTDPNQEFVRSMFGQYKPETQASDALLAALQNFPQREEPGRMRRILAAIASGGYGMSAGATVDGARVGFRSGATPAEKAQVSEQVMYPKYGRDIADWQMKIKPMEVAAQNERAFNANERANVNNETSRMIAWQLGQGKLAQGDRKLDIQAESNEIKRAEVVIKDYLARNPEADLIQNRDGTMLVFNPRTHLAETISDPTTGKPVAQVSKEAFEQIRNDAAQKRTETIASSGIQRVKVAAKYRDWQQVTDKDTGEVWLVEPGTTHAIKPTAEMLESGIPSATPPVATPQVVTPPVKTPTAPAVTPTPQPTPQPKQPTFISKPSQTKQPANLAAIQQTTQDTLQALDELLSPDNKLRPEIGKYVGLGRVSGFIEGHFPGAEARTTQAKIDRLKNLLSIELIGEMKAQSRTGATGFGQLSTKELEVMEKAASKLDPGIQKEAFEAELIRIKDRLRKILMLPGGPDVKRTPEELIEMYRKDKK